MNTNDDQTTISLSLSPIDACCLLAQLQLALRHPKNTGPSARVARQIADTLQDALSSNQTLKTLAELGWWSTPRRTTDD